MNCLHRHSERCCRDPSDESAAFSSTCTWACFCGDAPLYLLRQTKTTRTKESRTREASRERRTEEFDGREWAREEREMDEMDIELVGI